MRYFHCIIIKDFLFDTRLVQGKCISNVPEDGRNAVTWGVFPGKEIIQTTIIERESFLSWKVCSSVKTLRRITEYLTGGGIFHLV